MNSKQYFWPHYGLTSTTSGFLGVSFGGDGNIRSGLAPKGWGNTEVEIDILFELPVLAEIVSVTPAADDESGSQWAENRKIVQLQMYV